MDVQESSSTFEAREGPRRTVKLQFITVSETGASELLPLHPETLRVFLILKEARSDRKSKPSDSNPSPLPAPGLAVRHSRARVHPAMG